MRIAYKFRNSYPELFYKNSSSENFQETFMLEHYFNEVWNKELQLFENSNPPQVLSREFSKMLGTAICRLPETAL